MYMEGYFIMPGSLLPLFGSDAEIEKWLMVCHYSIAHGCMHYSGGWAYAVVPPDSHFSISATVI